MLPARSNDAIQVWPSMAIVMLWSSSSAHETTYLRNSRASGSCSAFEVSAFADSETRPRVVKLEIIKASEKDR